MVKLTGSFASACNNITSISILDPNESITATIFVRRKESDISLKDFADGILSGNIINPLSRDELKDKFGADNKDLDAVEEYITNCGITVTDRFRSSGTFYLTGTVGAFNSAFDTELMSIVTPEGPFRTYEGELSVPNNLDGIILHIGGLDNSQLLRSHMVTTESLTDLNSLLSSTYLSPPAVAKAYNFPSSTGAGQCIAILEFGGGYTATDLNNSFAYMGVSVPTTVDISVNGGTNNPSDTSSVGEVVLDIVVAGGVANGAKLAIYFAPGTIDNFATAINAAVNDSVNNPSVISISWGLYESDWGIYSTLMDTALQSAIAMGISVYVASGDTGAEAGVSGTPTYSVQLPAASTYCVSCGGTTLQLNPNGSIGNEYVWHQSTVSSGGGVSTIYSVPTWQTGLTTKTYPSGTISALSGRGIPDISSNGDPATGYIAYYNGHYYACGGTSAAAPLWAGFTARLNAITGSRLGFPLRLFYANTSAFNDITVGNNASPGALGYSATTGWDACTGLGTPNGMAILNLISQSRNGLTWPRLNKNSRPSIEQLYPRPYIRA